MGFLDVVRVVENLLSPVFNGLNQGILVLLFILGDLVDHLLDFLLNHVRNVVFLHLRQALDEVVE